MPERRPLAAGIELTQDKREQEFVYGGDHKEASSSAEVAPQSVGTTQHSNQSILPQISNRVPITTRTRPEIASALKRASLQRQLNGQAPFYVQDIIEEALESWLASHGFAG